MGEASAQVDEKRLWSRLMDMAAIGATPKGGVNRAALSAEDNQARRRLANWSRELGFETRIDAIGNIFVRRAGTDATRPPVVTGSHLDSQPTGGKFDGAYGVVGGFEALEAIERTGIETRHPIEVVAWTNEEGGRFQPGCMGSFVFIGEKSVDDIAAITDRAGITIAAALAETLAAFDDLPRRTLGSPVEAYVEAHIEQGPRLENEGNTIGVVTGIQGQRCFSVEVTGEEAHAGTTPLAVRKDALKAAMSMISDLETVMADETDTVRFTVGRFEVFPCSPNVVPGRVFFTIDFRHPDQTVITKLTNQIESICSANARGCTVDVQETVHNAPIDFDPEIVTAIREGAARLGLAHMDMPSGATHDALYLARVCPTGMIFVPCAGGVSHNEAESATAPDLAAGIKVLADTLASLAI